MLLALTKEAHTQMRDQWNQKKVWKKYVCLVEGWPVSYLNSAPIRTEHINKGKGGYSESKLGAPGTSAKPAHTFVEPLGRYRYKGKDYALCSCEILTGRTHQIRVHMSSDGHSLVGDDAYPRKRSSPSSTGRVLNRAFLHATALSFTIGTDRHLAVNPLASDLISVLKKMTSVDREELPWVLCQEKTFLKSNDAENKEQALFPFRANCHLELLDVKSSSDKNQMLVNTKNGRQTWDGKLHLYQWIDAVSLYQH